MLKILIPLFALFILTFIVLLVVTLTFLHPRLSDSDSEYLAEPITLQELELAAKSMNKAKSPGTDGIPIELYTTFWSDLGPLMLDMIHFSVSQGSFDSSINIAITSLL